MEVKQQWLDNFIDFNCRFSQDGYEYKFSKFEIKIGIFDKVVGSRLNATVKGYSYVLGETYEIDDKMRYYDYQDRVGIICDKAYSKKDFFRFVDNVLIYGYKRFLNSVQCGCKKCISPYYLNPYDVVYEAIYDEDNMHSYIVDEDDKPLNKDEEQILNTYVNIFAIDFAISADGSVYTLSSFDKAFELFHPNLIMPNNIQYNMNENQDIVGVYCDDCICKVDFKNFIKSQNLKYIDDIKEKV